MKAPAWCLNLKCDKPRRYSDPKDTHCVGCGQKFPTRPKRGKPIRAIPAHVWMIFDGDGKQVGPAFLSRPIRDTSRRRALRIHEWRRRPRSHNRRMGP